jgi:hypothetical protein
MTVSRWRNQRWRPLECEQHHPLEVARAALDDAVPIVTRDPLMIAQSLIEESAERQALEQLSDAELEKRAAREAMIAVCVTARAMIVKPAVVLTKPTEFGVLMRALAECLQAATADLARGQNGGCCAQGVNVQHEGEITSHV